MFRHVRTIALVAATAAAYGSVSAAPFENVLKNYNRVTSRVMIRSIAVPTLANLDYAAYFANPIRFDHQAVSPKKPAKKIGLADLTFGGALVSPCVSLSQTPLTSAEKDMPLAWDPLQNKLWEITKSDGFSKIGAQINGEKWADPSVFMAYQEIAAAYLHGVGDSTQLWVRIEFKPWVKFLDPSIPDEAKDGFREIYGRLNTDALDKSLRQKAFDWIRNDYTTTLLTKDQVIDWANLLASYWYPKLNTDVVDMTGQTKWPTPDADMGAIKELKGFVVKDPLVVIRGNPYGTILYNVFLVDFKEEKPKPASQAAVEHAASGPFVFERIGVRQFQREQRAVPNGDQDIRRLRGLGQEGRTLSPCGGLFCQNAAGKANGFQGKRRMAVLPRRNLLYELRRHGAPGPGQEPHPSSR